MRGRLGTLILASLACSARVLVACVGEDAQTSTTPTADAGGDVGTPVSGDPDGSSGAFDLKAPREKLTLTRGRTERVAITVDRKGFEGAVRVSITGTPSGITSNTITLPGSSTAGEVELVVDKSARQGDVAGMSVSASDESGNLTATLPLQAFVRGAPGELDTSFGTNGVVTLSTSSIGYETTVDTTGRIYVADDTTIRRLQADGTADPTFGSATGSTKTTGQPNGVAVVGTTIFATSIASTTGYLDKYLDTGARDTTYGLGSPKSGHAYIGAGANFATPIATTGRAAPFATFGDYFSVHWLDATGVSDNSINGGYTTGGPPNTLRAGLFVDDALVAVGGETGGYIVKLSTTNGLLDNAFGQGGTRLVDAGVVLDDVVRDAQGRFVISGFVAASKALFLTRITADGALDTTLPPTVSVVTKPFPLFLCISGCANRERSGRLALQSDGKILHAAQIDEQGLTTKCVLHRYAPDGKLDGAFGDGGKVTLPTPGCVAKRVHVQPDGRIIIGGPQIIRVWN